MPEVLVEDATVDSHTLQARFSLPGRSPTTLYLQANVPLATGAVTPWLPVALPLAMLSGSVLRIQGDVDTVALAGARQAQALLAGWFPFLRTVELRAAARPDPPGVDGRGAGCFFSCGVDSFFSVLRHSGRLTHLVFVHGFDIPVTDDALGNRVLGEARAAAAELGKQLVEVRTNIREVGQGLDWGTHLHGAAMATVALALAPVLHTVLVPSSYQLGNLHPWGSHPALDPLWSSSSVGLVHDGETHSRSAKVTELARSQVALDHLRVCWSNPDGAYNCGRCEKCLRTMISLHAVDALHRCKTLPHTVSPRAVRRMQFSAGALAIAPENLALLQANPRSDPAVMAALRRAVRRGRVRNVARRAKGLLSAVSRRFPRALPGTTPPRPPPPPAG